MARTARSSFSWSSRQLIQQPSRPPKKGGGVRVQGRGEMYVQDHGIGHSKVRDIVAIALLANRSPIRATYNLLTC